MIKILHALPLRGRSDHAKTQVASSQLVAVARVVTQTEHKCRRKGPVIQDQVDAVAIAGCEGQMGDSIQKVLLGGVGRIQPADVALYPSQRRGQAVVAFVMHLIWRIHGHHSAARVILILAASAEHIVVKAHAQQRPTGQRRIVRGAFLGLRQRGVNPGPWV